MSETNVASVRKDVDSEILEYITLDSPKSFLLFAGAGSGKTRTLVDVLDAFKKKFALEMVDRGQKVAVVTFTNAACDEIKYRLKYDPIFKVSTIHSFAWELIKPFNEDIKKWLEKELQAQVDELSDKLERARNLQGKTALQNAAKKEAVTRRLNNLRKVEKFSYSPSGGRPDKDSLNHVEVIKIATEFIGSEPLMQQLLVNRYPVLLIDESQDTKKELLDALIKAQQAFSEKFSLGLFGDLMQRIYSGGKEDLNRDGLPNDWEFPSKEYNFRCPKRVIKLINKVRSEVDNHSQCPREDAEEGFVRLFLVDKDHYDKYSVEQKIRNEMASITGDDAWLSKVKCLTLEHAMASRRGKFDGFFLPLSEVPRLRDSVLTGDSKTLRFLVEQLMPLISAIINNAEFEIMRLLKKYSPLLAVESISLNVIGSLSSKCEALKCLVEDEKSSILDVVEFVDDTRILACPDVFRVIILARRGEEDLGSEEGYKDQSDVLKSWEAALSCPLDQLDNYIKYLNDELNFGTHQGVKGLEFERVMAVLDDTEANGFLFGYEKLMGAEELSDTDRRNIECGKDSSPDRTRRLFYVICSRAEKSLALVNYTSDTQKVRDYMVNKSWFQDDEIILMSAP